MGFIPLQGRTVEVLSREEIQVVHQAVLELLKDPGVQIKHEEALDIFKRSGADVDLEKQVVHIHPDLLEYALNHAPRFMKVCGRNPKYDLKSNCGVHYSSGHGATMIIDFETGERRPATKKDLENNVRVHDALENTHFIFPEIYPQDVPEKALDRHISQALLSNTEKPVIATAYSGEGAKDLLRMGIAIAGSEEALRQRPMFTVSLGIISPFCFEPNRVDVLLEMCRFGHPFQIYTIPSTGTTSPVTLAGTLALMVAELLSGLVLTQLVNPGVPVRLMGYAGTADMRSGDFTFASPEKTLMAAALAQMLRFYGVPQAVHGSTTRANVLDAQAGYETGILNLFSALSGSDVVIECTSASLENTTASVPEQAIIANEICGFINRILEGIEVNPDTLAIDVIREIGPGGEYLTHDHTMKHFKSEQWDAKLGNRLPRDLWEEKGAMDIRARAREIYKKILDTHQPKPLDPDVQKKLHDIVAQAEA
ncbi:MAG: trimethylamine methyltransferase family protein [Deltaproteobacteria bacterium]|nr:trimethylamine methyltransferase family protein [Deltaproteobacteria bacterium]